MIPHAISKERFEQGTIRTALYCHVQRFSEIWLKFTFWPPSGALPGKTPEIPKNLCTFRNVMLPIRNPPSIMPRTPRQGLSGARCGPDNGTGRSNQSYKMFMGELRLLTNFSLTEILALVGGAIPPAAASQY